MSLSAAVFLVATCLSVLGALVADANGVADGKVLMFAAACFAALTLLALIRGKRVRFNPQLR
ncbi:MULTISPECIES: PA3371 family protein [unclassified Pseudomonas]|uniref:PA3371 family protein n=1 Tax=unclassified Pseudomonas TaxID=196821 RepID=UPI000BCF6698|nr:MULTISPECIES: PA3371 family protein [unclassified Pseudomonas]PVZ13760.1 hypothetical protein F474_02844 [Pseudomonas sp. URIL14HWK12:I12]PVZ24066.1 hypothetical protein F470_02499 [Pseudomonas sp. URIL14HWK12:I10]PVZ33295.1 hypothetical protein F472_02763 [Pseudomonas sp. URIL14HWK12:I11]SNZ11046.1 hypothetical protein SAMN05660463_01748 [Pseudomonas sp. URIL14HWK12:I9]